jgi:hypothetical protein
MQNEAYMAGLRRRHANIADKIDRLSRHPSAAGEVATLKKEKLNIKDTIASLS